MILSFDIGGTSIKYGLVNTDGEIEEVFVTQTDAHLGGQHIVSTIYTIIDEWMEKREIKGVALSTAGMVDPDAGEITYANSNIPNYRGIKWKEWIETRYGIPCEVENDSNCAGLAEAIRGAGNAFSHVLCVTVGTGIGSSLIIDQKLYHGSTNQAMEIGYLPMNGTILEKIASTSALVSNIKALDLPVTGDINGRVIVGGAKMGNHTYLKAIETMLDNLAQGLSHVIYTVNPDVLILGGGIMEQKDFIKPLIEEKFRRYLIDPVYSNLTIEFAKFGNSAGIIGAYENLRQKRFS